MPEPAQPIKVVIADDHQLFREGMGMIIRSSNNLELLYDVANGAELTNRLATNEQHPDVVLLDLKMPEKDGIETTRELHRDYPEIRILILTMHQQDDFILHLLDQGAHGYLLKDISADEVRNAIHTVYSKGNYFSDMVSAAMLRGLKAKNKSTPRLTDSYHITPRELEVLELIVQELTTSEIADKLFVSVKTVESHRKNIMEKLGVKNSAGLVYRAMKDGLVS